MALVCIYQFSEAISHLFYVTDDNHGKGMGGFDRCKRCNGHAPQILRYHVVVDWLKKSCN